MASEESLDVYLDGELSGKLVQRQGGDLRFRYADAYRAKNDPTPLSLSLPASQQEHRKRAVLPFFQNLLPDNANALSVLARRYGVSERNPFGLLRHIGADVAGALQILPEGADPTDVPGDPHIDRLTDGAVEELLNGVVEEYERGSGLSSVAGRFSLAGAQPKIALFRDEDSWALPRGSTPTTHIIKPVAGDFARLDVVEWMTMRAAHHLGLNVSTSEIITFGKTRAFVTTRYDRALVGGVWHRLHQEDLAQSLSVPPDKKYQHRDGGPGVAAVARVLRGLEAPEDRRSTAEDFYKGLVFNAVLMCTDAHVKNYSVLLSGPRTRLAPLYDLATYAPYASERQPLYSAMKIGDEYSFAKIGMPEYLAAAKTLGVDQGQAASFVTFVRENAIGAFEATQNELAHSPAHDADTRAVADSVVRSVSMLPGLASSNSP